MALTIVLIISLIFVLLYVYFIWNFNYWKKRGIPSPSSVPFLGSFSLSVFLQKENILYEVDKIYKKYKSSTPFVGIYSSRTPQLLAIDSEFIKDVLIRKFKNFHDNEFSDLIDKETDPIFARNPFMLSGDEWKEKRADITPAFTASKVKTMYPIIEDVCKKMNLYVKQEMGKNSSDGIDVKELASRYTTDVVSGCIYGVDSKAFTDEKSIIRQMGTTLFEPNVFLFVYFILVDMFPFISKFYQRPFVSKKIETFFTKLMSDAIALRENSKTSRDDYLNYLLELRKKKHLSDLDMAAHTITFFIDGYETSSVVISHILYQLALHRDIQNKLRDEINETIKKNGKLDFENIHDMQYMDQVFNETLRMFPPAVVATKKCTISTEVVDVKDKPIVIDKGIVVMIPIYSVHRDPNNYSDPETFDPERFSPENGGLKKYKDKGVFLAFGEGPRICLGMRFATAQTKAAVLEIIHNFEITVNKKTKFPYVADPKEFILKPVGGIWLDFKNIK